MTTSGRTLRSPTLRRPRTEAYARNYAMDQQEARLRELTEGNGPGYEEVPAWLRVTGIPEPSEVEANERYLDWLDDEYDGYEKGNPPKSRELDEVTEAASTWYPEHRDWPTTEVQRGENGHWEFEDWAQAHGYSDDDVARTYDVEGVRESRLAQREGQQMVDEIQRMADDPQYADVRDQIEDISGYVRQVMELGEPGRLWASGRK